MNNNKNIYLCLQKADFLLPVLHVSFDSKAVIKTRINTLFFTPCAFVSDFGDFSSGLFTAGLFFNKFLFVIRPVLYIMKTEKAGFWQTELREKIFCGKEKTGSATETKRFPCGI